MAIFSRSAVVDWNGELINGRGRVAAGTAAFTLPITFPRLGGEAQGHTTPEEMLAASHAICYAIALRSIIARREGKAGRVNVTATITADKGPRGIRIQSSHLKGIVEGLEGINQAELPEIAQAAEDECTISIAIRGAVKISFDVTSR
jgi:lipoyl-dependent peroxiredoxin